MFEVFGLSTDNPGVMVGLILQAIWYLGLLSMAILGLQCVISFVREVAHKIYPKITYSGFSAMSYLEDVGHLIIYAVKALVAILIIYRVTDLLPVQVAWALWLLLGWTILWNFPKSGLYTLERYLSYGIIEPVNQKAAEIVSRVYSYTYNQIVYAAAVFLGLKYILLPAYAPESAPFIEGIVLFAILMHFVWYFPFVGPLGIWHILPKRWISRYDPEGMDIPAKISFVVKDNVAIVKVSNVLTPLKGMGRMNIVRGHNLLFSFEFDIEPGTDFEIKEDLHINRLVSPLWYIDITLCFSDPYGLKGTRTFFPEKRGMSQRIMEKVYSLPSTLMVLYREYV